MRLPVLFYFIFLISCQSKQNSTSIIVGDLVYEGNNISENFLNDTVLIYNKNKKLLWKKTYKDNELNGISIEYHDNGIPYHIQHYSEGLKNGLSSYYNEDGKIVYSNNFYYDLPAGPLIFYDENQDPRKYHFISLENFTLLYIDYDQWTGIDEYFKKFIYYSLNNMGVGDEKAVSIFLYTMNPPKFNFTYTLCKKNIDKNQKIDTVNSISNNHFFTQLTVPSLPDDEKYVIGLKVYDSIMNKECFIFWDAD